MYANAPHASATTPPLSSLQHPAPQVQHGHPQGLPPAAHHGGSHGIPGQVVAPQQLAPRAVPAQRPGAAFVTGAYEASGDPMIDRMRRLEAACKRFGSPI